MPLLRGLGPAPGPDRGQGAVALARLPGPQVRGCGSQKPLLGAALFPKGSLKPQASSQLAQVFFFGQVQRKFEDVFSRRRPKGTAQVADLERRLTCLEDSLGFAAAQADASHGQRQLVDGKLACWVLFTAGCSLVWFVCLWVG